MNLIEKLFGGMQNEVAAKLEPAVEEKRKAAMSCLKYDRDGAYERLQMALSRQFVVAVKASNDGLFNGWSEEVDAKVGNFLAEKGLKLDASVQSVLLDLWDGVKPRLNECFFEACEKFALPIESVAPVATKLDAVIQGELKRYSGSYGSVVSSKDRVAEQHRGIYRAIAKAKTEYIKGLSDVLTMAFGSASFADVTALSEGTAALERSVEAFIQKQGIAGVHDTFKEEVSSATNQVARVANEAWDCAGDAFNAARGWFS